MKDRRSDLEKIIDEFFESAPKDFAPPEIEDDDPVFTLDIVSKLVHLPVWTVRNIIKEGLIDPQIEGKKKM